jgi:hypothetical protein
MIERPNLSFIVEGHCEFEGIPSFVAKILGRHCHFPIINAKGINNIIKNIDKELLILVKNHKPKNIIITLDGSDAINQGLCTTCVELKDIVLQRANKFIATLQNGPLLLPENIIVVIAEKTFDTWLCSDSEGLKTCDLIDSTKAFEVYTNVDQEIASPSHWIKSKLKKSANPKNRRNRKKLASSIRPEVGKNFSPSFDKFIREVIKNVA